MEKIPLIPLFLVESIYVLLRNQVIVHSQGCLEESLLTLLRISATIALFGAYRRFVPWQEIAIMPMKMHLRMPLAITLILIAIYALFNTQGTGDQWTYSALMFIVTPFVGIHEELANRRILQNRIRQHLGLLPTLVISNIIFCFFHFGVYSTFHIRDYGEIFLVGILLGILYDRTKNLFLVAALHTVYDWIWIFGPFVNSTMQWQIASFMLLVAAIPFALRINCK